MQIRATDSDYDISRALSTDPARRTLWACYAGRARGAGDTGHGRTLRALLIDSALRADSTGGAGGTDQRWALRGSGQDAVGETSHTKHEHRNQQRETHRDRKCRPVAHGAIPRPMW